MFLSRRSRNSFCWHRERRYCNDASHCWKIKLAVFSAIERFKELHNTFSFSIDNFICNSLKVACTESNATSINISTWKTRKGVRNCPENVLIYACYAKFTSKWLWKSTIRSGADNGTFIYQSIFGHCIAQHVFVKLKLKKNPANPKECWNI